MRFGNRENNKLSKLLQTAFGFLIFCSCAFSVACQSRQQKIDSALKSCQDLLDKDDIAEAYKCYLKVGTNYPENDPYIVDKGDRAIFTKCVEFKEKKDFEQAAFCLEGLTKLRPGGANIYFLLADSYYELFQQESKETGYQDFDLLKKAEEMIKKGLEISSEDAAAHTLYGGILKDKGDKQAALREYQKAVKISPKTKVFWTYYALAQEKFDENQGAIESYKQVLLLNPSDTLALYHLGKLYEKVGEKDKAIEVFEKLSKIDPDYDDVLDRLKVLKEQRELEQQKPSRPKTKAAGQSQGIGNKP